MGTTLSTTIGWGFPLTEKDVDKLDYAYYESAGDREEYDDYDNWIEYNQGEGVWEALRKFNLWDYGSSYYYEYGPEIGDGKYYVHLKRMAKTFYGVGFTYISTLLEEFSDFKDSRATPQEMSEWNKLEQLLGHSVITGPFIETSIG